MVAKNKHDIRKEYDPKPWGVGFPDDSSISVRNGLISGEKGANRNHSHTFMGRQDRGIPHGMFYSTKKIINLEKNKKTKDKKIIIKFFFYTREETRTLKGFEKRLW